MTLLLFLKLSAAVISVALGAGILARDHGLAANRLMAAFLFCNAWWASCEFHLYKLGPQTLNLGLDVGTYIVSFNHRSQSTRGGNRL